VSFPGFPSGFSSTGPTSDGRIKPDIAAPGERIYCASTVGYDRYTFQNGTSMASPLAAGTVALLLSVRPELTPVEVREILRATADTSRILNASGFPNNLTGWGYLDAFAAVTSSGPVFSNRPSVDTSGGALRIVTDVLSSSGIPPGNVVLSYRPEDDSAAAPATITMGLDSAFLFGGSGRFVADLPSFPEGTGIAFTISAVDSAGSSRTNPSPLFTDRWVFRVGTTVVDGPPTVPSALRLFQNYPNPFNGSTHIVYDLPGPGAVSVRVYDILGRLVSTLFDGFQPAGPPESRAPVVFRADGLPGGVYFCRLSTPWGSQVNKMMLLK